MNESQRTAALRLADSLVLLTHPWAEEAADLLRELASEPQAEPVGWAVFVGDEHFKTFETEDNAVLWYRQEYAYGSPYDYKVRPLYAHPPQRKPLSDEQINEMGVECGVVSEGYWSEAQIEFARAIERAHGIGA